ncbi:GNAT family N-acetyltransferase [Variovorax humicola]|uniref:GNAT family N-acetyltransferase n=1 Tax=Variovorax humicola TaxID=1769758 RepID=A0ABU8W9H1_9BURK
MDLHRRRARHHRQVRRNLLTGGFAGTVYGVSPKPTTRDGLRIHACAADLPSPPEPALLFTPADTIAPFIAQLGALGTRAAVNRDGRAHRRAEAGGAGCARPYLMRLLGPKRAPAAGAERFAILPYPVQWVRHASWNGRSITIRPIRPEDEGQHADFLRRLSMEDIRMRIFLTRRELPRSELARLTQIDYDREMAFIAEDVDAGGRAETLGVARTVSDPDNTEAEFAIIVRSDLNSAGLGRLLFQQLIEHARSRGTGRLVGIVLRENARMLNLARAMGFADDHTEPANSDQRRIVLPLAPRSLVQHNTPAADGAHHAINHALTPPVKTNLGDFDRALPLACVSSH